MRASSNTPNCAGLSSTHLVGFRKLQKLFDANLTTLDRSSDQSRLRDGRLDKAGEQRVRRERLRLQLRMELHAHEPGMVWPLDDFGQFAVGRQAGKDQALLLERVAVMDVDFVAVAVALADHGLAVDRRRLAVAAQFRRIGAEAHRAAKVAIDVTLFEA